MLICITQIVIEEQKQDMLYLYLLMILAFLTWIQLGHKLACYQCCQVRRTKYHEKRE